MADTDGIVLEHLRAIRAELGELRTDTVEIRERVGSLKQQYSTLSSRVDRMAGDIAQIKKRLDLVNA